MLAVCTSPSHTPSDIVTDLLYDPEPDRLSLLVLAGHALECDHQIYSMTLYIYHLHNTGRGYTILLFDSLHINIFLYNYNLTSFLFSSYILHYSLPLRIVVGSHNVGLTNIISKAKIVNPENYV